MYYPVAVPGALFSVGDSHAAQGDSELCGTAIEMSLTGTFQLILHKQNTLTGSLAGLSYPLLETQDEWVLHGFSFANYLEELGPTAQQDIYSKSSIDLALRDGKSGSLPMLGWNASGCSRTHRTLARALGHVGMFQLSLCRIRRMSPTRRQRFPPRKG
jgi:acetamidase/formamidase